MSNGPLQIRYRPKTLKGFFGNASLKTALRTSLDKEHKPTSFLFTGESGTGKTTLGRIIANELEIDPLNVHVYNAASTRGIDTIREAIEQAKHTPLIGNKRIYIFEESHQLTGAAQESLLDFVEHPPKDTFIVLTTTEPSALKVTLKRRCFLGEVKPLMEAELQKLMLSILKREQETASNEVVEKIISASNGSAGQALKLLDMVIGVDDTKALELLTDIFVNETGIIEICRTLLNMKLNSGQKWKQCQKLLETITGEPESNRRIVQGYFNSVLLKRPYDDQTAIIASMASNFTGNYYDSGKLGLLLSVFLSCE
jgi:DNA polymerase III gamma/tau subunit